MRKITNCDTKASGQNKGACVLFFDWIGKHNRFVMALCKLHNVQKDWQEAKLPISFLHHWFNATTDVASRCVCENITSAAARGCIDQNLAALHVAFTFVFPCFSDFVTL